MNDKTLSIIIKAQDQASRVFEQVGSRISTMTTAATTASKLAGAALLAGTTAAVVFGVKSAASFEQTRIGLENMLGSAEVAKNVLSQVSKFAKDTPFEFPELAGAVKQLVAFGFTGDDALKTMKQLGDVSAAIGAPIGDLSYLMGTLKTQGRAFTIDIRQFAQRGVPIYEYLAKVLHTNTNELTGMIEAGKVGFPEVSKAFELMTAEGGKFHGAMAKQSQSLSGLYSTLKDSVGQALREMIGITQEGDVQAGSIFDRLRIATAGVINAMPQFIATIQSLQPYIPIIAGAIAGMLVPALISLALSIGASMLALAPFIIAGAALVAAYQFSPALFWAIAGAVAAFGAAMFVSALPSIIAATVAMGGLATATIAATWPFVAIGAAAALAAYLIFSNWSRIAAALAPVTNEIDRLRATFNSLPLAVRIAFTGIGEVILSVLGPIGTVVNALMKLNSIMGNIGSAGGAVKNTLHSLHIAGFASGGYTGSGGTNEVAGIVHKGEYVVPKSQVDQSTGQPYAGAGGVRVEIHGDVVNQTAEAAEAFWDRVDQTQRLAKIGMA
jgi:hypothetical protein